MSKPVAVKRPFESINHGDIRIDDYAWLKDPEWRADEKCKNQEIIDHLNKENQYAENVLSPLKELSDKILEEMKGRIKFGDKTVPYREGNYMYYSKLNEEQEYWQHWRYNLDTESEELLLDENELAKDRTYVDIGTTKLSPDQNLYAFTLDDSGDEYYTVHIKNLETNEVIDEFIKNTNGRLDWDPSGNGFFYMLSDENHRHNKLYYHKLGSEQNTDLLIYHETNDEYFLSTSRSSDKSVLIIGSGNGGSDEYKFMLLNGNYQNPELKTIVTRSDKVLYECDIANGYCYVKINDIGPNFRLIRTTVNNGKLGEWNELVSHNVDKYLTGFGLSDRYLSYSHKNKGLVEITVRKLETGKENKIKFDDESYSASYSYPTYEVEQNNLQIVYSSLGKPRTTYDYVFETDSLIIRKIQDIPSGFVTANYTVKRLWAPSLDGTLVPISLVYNNKLVDPLKSPAPLFLYGYGSYGLTIEPSFNSRIVSFLDRGIIYAVAHIRGGDDLGFEWYTNAKFLNKKRTFEDFIACAKYLIDQKYTTKGKIAAMGRSAGGMLMGSILNMNPELFKVVVAGVPFVDVLTTMLDSKLPLTPGEYTEWGNPEDPEYYHYIKSYSPYDNIVHREYPQVFVTAGLTDPRVTYWEPAKWVAKLREHNVGNSDIILKTEMVAGHFGQSGITDELKDYALQYAFMIHHLTN